MGCAAPLFLKGSPALLGQIYHLDEGSFHISAVPGVGPITALSFFATLLAFACVAALALQEGLLRVLPFLLMLAVGPGYVGARSSRSTVSVASAARPN